MRPGLRRPDDPASDQPSGRQRRRCRSRARLLRLAPRRRRAPGARAPARLRPGDPARSPSGWPTLLWLLGAGGLGAYAERGVAWWSIGSPIASLSPRLRGLRAARPETEPAPEAASSQTWSQDARPPSLGGHVDRGRPGRAVVALLPVWRSGDPLYGPSGLLTDAPRGITDTLLATARPGDRIWNAQRWGSWLEYAVPRPRSRSTRDRADPGRRLGGPSRPVVRRHPTGRRSSTGAA